MNKYGFNKKLNGYTLAEILIVLAIIGILISMAVPMYMSQVSKAKTLEAQTHLNFVLQLEKSYYYVHSKYSESLSDIGYEPGKLVSEDGTANYKIEISSASSKGFVARATSVTDFDSDGAFNVWEVNQDSQIKETIKD